MGIEGFGNNKTGNFSPGDPITAKNLNLVSAGADRGNIVHGDASTIQGPFGTVFMGQPNNTVVENVYNFPFRISVGKDTVGLFATVRPGTVNNFIPKTDFGVYLDNVEVPKIRLNDTGIYDIVIKATKDTTKFFPTTVIVQALKRDTYADTDTFGYLVLGSVTIQPASGAVEKRITYVGNNVFASQVVVRVKPGSAAAIWSWSSR